MCNLLNTFITALSLTLGATAAHAAEFSCDIANKGRSVTLTLSGQTVSYAYGKKGAAPELALTVPISAVELYAWEGFGRTPSYSIGVPNGQYLYTVYTAWDKIDHTEFAGVNVEKNEKLLTQLQCDVSTVDGDLEKMVLDLKARESGE